MQANLQASRIRNFDAVATVVAVLLLLGAAGTRLQRPNPSDSAPYHQRVRAAAESIPLRTGDWIATDLPVPAETEQELRPNVLISRRLRNVRTGVAVSLLLVQCPDIRSITPHYPPVCYPGQGLTLTGTEPVVLRLSNSKLNATRYTFESSSFKAGGMLQVDNFMVLPDGSFQADMRGMERRIGANQRYFGAAQVQIVYGDNTAGTNRTEISEAILHCYEPLIDSISSGTKK